MRENSGIKSVAVEGLHDQFDLDLDFKPGLNIIYGKNGRGKTTLLHILANALEFDFKRFRYLKFKRIRIETLSNNVLEIQKLEHPEKLRVLINGAATSIDGDSSSLTEAELDGLREMLGDRPTYLPAFRSILERIRPGYSPQAYGKSEAQDEIEKYELHTLMNTSLSAIKGVVSNRATREEAASTARKTMQCRDWFGEFTPIVRYPSIIEVDEGLTYEWRNAQIEIAQREHDMFAKVFDNVFQTIIEQKQIKDELTIDELSAAIDQFASIDFNDKDIYGPTNIYNQIHQALNFILNQNKRSNKRKSSEISILRIYLETLLEQSTARRKAFQKKNEFEASVNKFLDNKSLRIQSRPSSKSTVYLVAKNGSTYGLSALSSGERQILTMLYSASRSRFKNAVFLIDEPELSLHIDWQRLILKEVMSQAPSTQIIACTHSPEVGADHWDTIQEFEPKPVSSAQQQLFMDDFGQVE